MMIPIYEDKPVDTNVRMGDASGSMLQVASGAERLMARLGADRDKMAKLAEPEITEETVNKALKDVEEGNINTNSVAAVAKNVYRNTANKAFMADIELSGSQLGTKIRTDQQARGQYDANSFKKSWDAYSKSTLKGIDDPQIRENAGNVLLRQGEQFGSQILSLQTTQQRSRQKESLVTKLNADKEAMKEAIGVPGTANEVLRLQKEIEVGLSSLRMGGFYTSEKIEAENKEINKEVYTEKILKDGKVARMNGEGEKFISDFADSNQAMYDEKEQYAIVATLNSQMANERRGKKNALAAQSKTSTIMVDDGKSIYKAGKEPTNVAQIEANLQFVTPKKQHDYQIAKSVYTVMQTVSDLSIPQQEAFVASERAKEKGTKLSTEVLDAAEKSLATIKSEAEKDPITRGVTDGLFEQPETITVGKTNTIGSRMALSAQTNRQYGTKPKLLTEVEADGFIAFFDNPDITTGQKLDVITGINANGTEAAELVYSQIGKSKEAYNFAFAGELSEFGNSVAAEIAMKGKGADIKLEEGIKFEVDTELSGVFGSFNSEYYNQNKKGIVDYMKGKLLQGEAVSASEAVENTIGQVATYNNKKTVLPFGVDKGDFDTWIDNYEIKDNPQATEGLQAINDSRISSLFEDDEYQLHYVGPGKYHLWKIKDGLGMYVVDRDNPNDKLIIDYRGD